MAEQDLPFSRTQSQGYVHCPIRGMKSVVATVTGYHGSERFSLIKLIAHAGASYVGGMSRSITHLVCWKFEGKKYDLANKFGSIIVNHRWIEDCIKQGKRVSERPYMLQCGQELGPLLLEVPDVPKVSVSNKKLNVLSDKSNGWDDFERQNGNMELGASSQSVWTHSSLLNENLYPEVKRAGNSSQKLKQIVKTFKPEPHSRTRQCFQKHFWSGSLELQNVESSSRSSGDLVRYRTKFPIDNESIRLETSRKGRRLVERNMTKDQMRLALSESDEECCLIRVHSPHDDEITVLSDHLDGARNNIILESGQTSNHGFYNQRKTANEGYEDNDVSTSMDPILRVEDSITLETTSQDQVLITENSKEENNKGPEDELDNKFPSSNELSCVICWTDFSTVRGILPCGHRFCYSCIQNWADHMAARRKRSTCPLCKASFTSITKFEDTANGDQKIYSQTIPCDSSMMNTFFLPDWETSNISAQHRTAPVCSACRWLEPQDLLVSCHVCQIQQIHSYCLDPPLFPWTCSHCKDLHMLYLHNR